MLEALARVLPTARGPQARCVGACRGYAGHMAIARLHGGPLDGQIVPLDPAVNDSYIVPYGEGQLVYRRNGGESNTGEGDGPTEVRFEYVEATEDIDPNPDGRDG